MKIIEHYDLVVLALIIVASLLMIIKGIRHDLRNTVFPVMLAILTFLGGLIAGDIVSPPEDLLIPDGQKPGAVLLGMLVGSIGAYVLYRIIRPMIFKKPKQGAQRNA